MTSTCDKVFTIPEVVAGIDWSLISWDTVSFFESPPDSHSTGSVVGDTIACQCDGTPATSSGGLELVGDLVYTGPLVNAKLTIFGGPFSTAELMSFGINISHSTAGVLLDVTRDDIIMSPQVFPFVVPASAADTINIVGDTGGNILMLTQNPPGVISTTIVFANQ